MFVVIGFYSTVASLLYMDGMIRTNAAHCQMSNGVITMICIRLTVCPLTEQICQTKSTPSMPSNSMNSRKLISSALLVLSLIGILWHFPFFRVLNTIPEFLFKFVREQAGSADCW